MLLRLEVMGGVSVFHLSERRAVDVFVAAISILCGGHILPASYAPLCLGAIHTFFPLHRELGSFQCPLTPAPAQPSKRNFANDPNAPTSLSMAY